MILFDSLDVYGFADISIQFDVQFRCVSPKSDPIQVCDIFFNMQGIS